MAHQLYHLGLNVRDFGKSYDFYTQIVGFKVDTDDRPHRSVLESGTGPVTWIENDREGAFMTKGAETDELHGGSGLEIKGAHLVLDGFRLQILEYVAGGGEPVDVQHNRPGSPHFCFYVDDAHAKLEEIKRRGDIKITHEVVRIFPTMDSFYVEDPDGVPVEFLQVIAQEMSDVVGAAH